MHVAVVSVIALSALLPEGIWARSTGAPVGACNRIFPEGHGGSSQNLSTSPYTLDISALSGGYNPGQTYTRMYIVFPSTFTAVYSRVSIVSMKLSYLHAMSVELE